MKKRFSEEQIIGFLREADAGVAIKDLRRSKFDGMSVSAPIGRRNWRRRAAD